MALTEGLTCTHSAIKLDVPLQIWEGVSSYRTNGLALFLVRVLHNKVRYYSANYAECYLYYYSPKFWLQFLHPAIFVAVVFFIYNLIKKRPRWRKVLIPALLLYPLVMIFELYR